MPEIEKNTHKAALWSRLSRCAVKAGIAGMSITEAGLAAEGLAKPTLTRAEDIETDSVMPGICTENCCIPEKDILCASMHGTRVEKPKLLLHSCCGPCSTSVIERLAATYKIAVFYYNPNIHDAAEYEKRRDTQIDFISKLNDSNLYEDKIEFTEGEYDTESFFKVSAGLEDENEGGARCEKCFRLRLERTAAHAKTHGFDTFATTLTVSPYKNYKVITEIGQDIAFKYGLSYLDMDFKKKDGYKRSIELSKQYGLYRQHYCGCVFSMPKQNG